MTKELVLNPSELRKKSKIKFKDIDVCAYNKTIEEEKKINDEKKKKIEDDKKKIEEEKKKIVEKDKEIENKKKENAKITDPEKKKQEDKKIEDEKKKVDQAKEEVKKKEETVKQEEKKNKLQPSPSTVPAPSVSYNLHEFAVDEPATTESKIIDKPSPKKAENNSPSNPQPNSKSAREEVEEGTPGAQPKNVDKPVSSHDEVELIIVNSKNKEQTNKEPEITEEKGNPITHYTLDTLYDPTLELSDFKLPTADLLQTYPNENANVYKEEIEDNKKRIVETLNNYQIDIQQIKATIGPAVTLYEIIPAPGIRISKIKNLEDDIALSLSALGIRIIAPIPGKGTIGIEVPNLNPEIVSMRSLITSEKFITTRFDLPIALGKTISNECYIADLSRMPHLLMAGATGQGKSVGLNVIITSLLYKKHPAEVKFILVDPKKVELSLFSKIERHYLAKLPDCEEAIITDIRQVVRTLNSLCIEMDDRYALMKSAQVRTIKEYNHKFIHRRLDPNEGHHYMPYIVLIVDEFADLIMTAGKEIELPLTRLAQLALSLIHI